MNGLIVSLSCRFSLEILCLSSDHLIIKEARTLEPEETQTCYNYVRASAAHLLEVWLLLLLIVTQLCPMDWARVTPLSLSSLELISLLFLMACLRKGACKLLLRTVITWVDHKAESGCNSWVPTDGWEGRTANSETYTPRSLPTSVRIPGRVHGVFPRPV